MEIKEEKTSMSEAIMKFEKVPFMGQYVNATADESHYVALKPLVESIGLNWDGIRQLLNRSILGTTTVMVHVVAEDGKMRQMVCLPLDKLEGFLFLINPNNYDGEVKQRLITYQLECFKVLHDYFTKGIAVNPYANLPRSELFRMLAEAEDEKERQEKMLQEQKETIRMIGEARDSQTAMSIRLQGKLMRTKAVADRFAPVGDCPEGFYERRGSYCRKPKRRKVDVAEARQLLLGIPQKDVSAEE